MADGTQIQGSSQGGGAAGSALEDRVEEVVAGRRLGRASALRRGRNPRWPYVPVIVGLAHNGGEGQEQIKGVAFDTREKAIAHAERVIAARKSQLREQLLNPCFRGLRAQFGLPAEIAQ